MPTDEITAIPEKSTPVLSRAHEPGNRFVSASGPLDCGGAISYRVPGAGRNLVGKCTSTSWALARILARCARARALGRANVARAGACPRRLMRHGVVIDGGGRARGGAGARLLGARRIRYTNSQQSLSVSENSTPSYHSRKTSIIQYCALYGTDFATTVALFLFYTLQQ